MNLMNRTAACDSPPTDNSKSKSDKLIEHDPSGTNCSGNRPQKGTQLPWEKKGRGDSEGWKKILENIFGSRRFPEEGKKVSWKGKHHKNAGVVSRKRRKSFEARHEKKRGEE